MNLTMKIKTSLCSSVLLGGLFLFAQGPGGQDVTAYQFAGTIGSLPGTPTNAGNWMVGNRSLQVTGNTTLVQANGNFAQNGCVVVTGTLDNNNQFTATRIESQPASVCPAQQGATPVNLGFFGTVTALPSTGNTGTWTVGGRSVTFGTNTTLNQGSGPLNVGSCVLVSAPQITSSGAISASAVQVVSASNCQFSSVNQRGNADFRGVVQSVPQQSGNTSNNTWVIAGRTVITTSATNIQPNNQTPAMGDCVDVRGDVQSNGNIIATRIQILGRGACNQPQSQLDSPRLVARIDQLPASGNTGTWRIGGQTVNVTTTTRLDSDRGQFQSGTCVEVRGTLQAGVLQANRLEVIPATECSGNNDAFQYAGIIETAPASGTTGSWTISGRNVTTTANTQFVTTRGNALVGSCVLVTGPFDSSTGFSATRVEVLSSSGVCLFPRGVANTGSYSSAAIAPGQIVSLFGLNIGPTADVQTMIENNRVTTVNANTRVFFDGVPAPIIFGTRGQINVMVPCSIAGRSSVMVTVENNGAFSNTITVPVQTTGPAIFTLNASGQGQAAVLNYNQQTQSYVVNGPAQQATAGSIIAIYATGLGETSQACTEGGIWSATGPFATLNTPVRVLIGGREAQVLYSGPAPGFVQGVYQINAVVPTGVTAGNEVPIVLESGTRRSASGVTIAVR